MIENIKTDAKVEPEKETFKEYASHLLTVAGRLDEYFSNSNV